MSNVVSTVTQAYQFALDPTSAQADALRSHCGGARFAYNWGLARVKANLAQRRAQRSYGIPEDELTPSLNWSAYALRKDWNHAKSEVAPWWSGNSKEAYADGLANLADALGNWRASATGRRAGKAARFPRFKTRRGRWSYTITTGAFGPLDTDRRHVKLPRVGAVRTHESTRKLARHLNRGTGRVLRATVSHSRGRWFVSFTCEIHKREPHTATRGGAVGVDLGVKHLAVLSTGEVVDNPKHLDRGQRKLRRLQRRASRRAGPDRRTRQVPSNRWYQTQDRIRKLHAHVANARTDGLHQLSTRLVAEFDTIVIENLNVSGMMRNRRLARRIADVGMTELRRQLGYKTTWYGRELVVADRWFPSSKTCNDCGAVKTKLRLSERTFVCGQCGVVLDRDANAARNLAALAGDVGTGGASSPRCGATVNEPAGNPRKTSSAGYGYRHGKTPRRGPTPRSNTTAQDTFPHVS